MKIWYKKLGFHENPFSIKPGFFNHDIFGNDELIKKINKKLLDSKVVFISGEFGTGKTSVLKSVVANYKKVKKKKILYYNCNRSEEDINYKKLLLKKQGFLKRLFKVKAKGALLLLDEVQDMTKADINELKAKYAKGNFSAIILVSKFEDFELLSELEDIIGENKFRMRGLTQKTALDLVKSRIGEIDLLSEKVIKTIFKKDKNPRAFLKNCEDVCKYCFENDIQIIEELNVKEALK